MEQKKREQISGFQDLHIIKKDIWWVSVGVNVGFEEDGKNDNFVRPVLVLKKFNNDMFLGIP